MPIMAQVSNDTRRLDVGYHEASIFERSIGRTVQGTPKYRYRFLELTKQHEIERYNRIRPSHHNSNTSSCDYRHQLFIANVFEKNVAPATQSSQTSP